MQHQIFFKVLVRPKRIKLKILHSYLFIIHFQRVKHFKAVQIRIIIKNTLTEININIFQLIEFLKQQLL